jgi:hypothetical protein
MYSLVKNKARVLTHASTLALFFVLSRQVSNLNSSDPESDVLPITPRDNFRGANIEIFSNGN